LSAPSRVSVRDGWDIIAILELEIIVTEKTTLLQPKDMVALVASEIAGRLGWTVAGYSNAADPKRHLSTPDLQEHQGGVVAVAMLSRGGPVDRSVKIFVRPAGHEYVVTVMHHAGVRDKRGKGCSCFIDRVVDELRQSVLPAAGPGGSERAPAASTIPPSSGSRTTERRHGSRRAAD
jgi:hypothetical protein